MPALRRHPTPLPARCRRYKHHAPPWLARCRRYKHHAPPLPALQGCSWRPTSQPLPYPAQGIVHPWASNLLLSMQQGFCRLEGFLGIRQFRGRCAWSVCNGGRWCLGTFQAQQTYTLPGWWRHACHSLWRARRDHYLKMGPANPTPTAQANGNRIDRLIILITDGAVHGGTPVIPIPRRIESAVVKYICISAVKSRVG